MEKELENGEETSEGVHVESKEDDVMEVSDEENGCVDMHGGMVTYGHKMLGNGMRSGVK